MSTYTPPLFSDIGKKAKDLFKKKYNFDNSLVVKHKNKSKKDCTLSIESRGNVGACCGVYGETKVTCEGNRGKPHKVEVDASTCGKINANVEIKELAPNVTVKLNAGLDSAGNCGPSSCGDKKAACSDSKEGCSISSCLSKLSGGAAVQYRQNGFSGSLGACHKKKTCVAASAVVGSNGLSAGASVSADPAAGSVNCYGVGVQYEHSEIVLALTSENKLRSHNVSAFVPVNKDTQLAINYAYSPDEKCAKKQRVLCAGVEYAAAVDTTIKAKASSTGCASLNVEHRLNNPNVLLGFSAGFSLLAPKTGCSASPDKFGVQLTFGDNI